MAHGVSIFNLFDVVSAYARCDFIVPYGLGHVLFERVKELVIFTNKTK
jgi:hypothetical protein